MQNTLSSSLVKEIHRIEGLSATSIGLNLIKEVKSVNGSITGLGMAENGDAWVEVQLPTGFIKPLLETLQKI